MSMSSLNSIGQSIFQLEAGNENVDGQMDVGHINLIGGLVTRTRLKSTHSEDINNVTFLKIKDFLYPEYDPVFPEHKHFFPLVKSYSHKNFKIYRNMLITFAVISNTDTQETINRMVWGKNLMEVCAL